MGAAHKGQVALSDDRYISGLAAVVRAVHAHGGKFAVQLHHGGPNAHAALAAGLPAWAPSPPKPQGRAPPNYMLPEEEATSPHARKSSTFKVLTADDISRVVDQFATAAGRAVLAGVDGIEIHGGHGYILSSFLSRRTNRRTDDYGGGLENRARLLSEVIGSVRAAVGPDFPLWCKLDSREEGSESDISLENAIRTAQIAEAAGLDAITVTATSNPGEPQAASRSHTPQTPAVNLPAAAAIKARAKIPIISSGRIELNVAEAAIATGRLDFLSMGRKILADPDLPRKVVEGRPDEIRPCIYCYTCISAIKLGLPVRCAVNPQLGVEPDFAQVSRPRRVMVIGGGPGGMETARRLDQDGHEVVLVEREKRLGGTLRFAAVAYPENEGLLRWLRTQLGKSRVKVRLGLDATLEMARQLQPDAVVVASGARRGPPPIPGADLPHVLSGDDLKALVLGQRSQRLDHRTSWATRLAVKVGAATGLTANLDFLRWTTQLWMPLGRRIVIIGGDLVGLELAEFLVERHRQVAVVDEIPRFGAGLQYMRRIQVLESLREHNVALHSGASGIHIVPHAVIFYGQERPSAPDSIGPRHPGQGRNGRSWAGRDPPLCWVCRACCWRPHWRGLHRRRHARRGHRCECDLREATQKSWWPGWKSITLLEQATPNGQEGRR